MMGFKSPDARNAYQRSRRAFAKAVGRCGMCGSRPARNGRTQCVQCAENQNRRRNRDSGSHRTDEQREARRRYMRSYWLRPGKREASRRYASRWHALNKQYFGPRVRAASIVRRLADLKNYRARENAASLARRVRLTAAEWSRIAAVAEAKLKSKTNKKGKSK